MGIPGGIRNIADIFADLRGQTKALLIKEGQLARAEIAETTGRAAIGISLIVSGIVLLLPAFVLLLVAAVAALVAYGFAAYWAALIVAGVVFLLSVVLMGVGTLRMKSMSIVPRKAINQLRRDASLVKAQMKPSAQ